MVDFYQDFYAIRMMPTKMKKNLDYQVVDIGRRDGVYYILYGRNGHQTYGFELPPLVGYYSPDDREITTDYLTAEV